MAIRIVMPKLGMVMSEGTVSHWTKKTGDYVSSGEVLAEIQTEKINYELEATGDGLFHCSELSIESVKETRVISDIAANIYKCLASTREFSYYL